MIFVGKVNGHSLQVVHKCFKLLNGDLEILHATKPLYLVVMKVLTSYYKFIDGCWVTNQIEFYSATIEESQNPY